MNLVIWDIESSNANPDFGSIIEIGGVLVDENFKEKLKDLQIDVDDFLNSISKKETKEKLIKLTQDAFNKKIFGAPTFICNDKIFWGQDRLDYAIEEFSS